MLRFRAPLFAAPALLALCFCRTSFAVVVFLPCRCCSVLLHARMTRLLLLLLWFLCVCGAALPSDKTRGLPVESSLMSLQLSDQFLLLVSHVRALRKAFMSIKGFFFQAELLGRPVTWLIPHAFAQVRRCCCSGCRLRDLVAQWGCCRRGCFCGDFCVSDDCRFYGCFPWWIFCCCWCCCWYPCCCQLRPS